MDYIGKTLGQYEVLSLIGKGGMATVYSAWQASMERDVAIKVISGDLAGNANFIARFEREARVIARLQHPHILPVYDFGRQDDVLFLVMRLVEGGSLDQRLHKAALPVSLVARMFTQIASALSYGHDQGIIHRDLKPNNILLDIHDNPYLTDFGIAKMVQDSTSSLTAPGTVMGTPAYMAPEMWRGETIDARADIYALGIMLYEMLTGDLPFKGDTPYAMMYMHFDAPPPSLAPLKPDLPEGVAAVIGKALAKHSQDRYGSAEQMAQDLNDALAGKTTAIRTPTGRSASENESTFISGRPTPAASKASPNATAPSPGSAAGLGEKTFVGDSSDAHEGQSVPSKKGRTLGIGLIVLAALVVGVLLVSAQVQNNANQGATQLALAPTQTLLAQSAATGTAIALAPRATSTATPSLTDTPTLTSTAPPTATPTPDLPTAIRFVDYKDMADNIKIQVPAQWEVQKSPNYGYLITPHYAALKFNSDGTIISNPDNPYLQLAVGNAQAFGSLDMEKASTPMDALVSMLGGGRLQSLDPVFGSHFSTARASRTKSAQSVIKVWYLLTLGPNRFAVIAFEATPTQVEDIDQHIAQPLVRTFDFATAPTPAPVISDTPTPTAAVTFVMPTAFDTFTSHQFGISFKYPSGWISGEMTSGIILSSSENTGGGLDPNAPPYISILHLTQKDLLNYHPENTILDLYLDNLGMMSVQPKEVDGAPYPSAIGRSLANTQMKINGWFVFVKLDEQNFLEILAQAPRGQEDAYRDQVIIPIVQSLQYQAPHP
ncbi:MAG TPA: protein kinase [Aggregatilineales bacterium]|nr:protein kinase [Aggregatilineales bacterium]